jgi:hypothetical protein
MNVGPTTPGDLNYLFSIIVNEYLEKRGLSYQIINDVVGALEGAKLEFYNRIAVPYEQKKREENGDVYTEMDHLSVRSDDRNSEV